MTATRMSRLLVKGALFCWVFCQIPDVQAMEPVYRAKMDAKTLEKAYLPQPEKIIDAVHRVMYR